MTSRPGDEVAAGLQHFGLQRDSMKAALARAAGLGHTALDALEHLEADGALTQRELGDRLMLTSGAITMLVDRLEQAGQVRRRSHPTDRRAVLLELTPKTLEQAPPALATYHAEIRAITAALPPPELEIISAFLEAAAAAASVAAARLRGETGTPGGGPVTGPVLDVLDTHEAARPRAPTVEAERNDAGDPR